AVDLHRAGAAFAGLAVPAHGQVTGLGRLQPVQDIQDDLALVGLDLVVGQLALPAVAPPDPELYLRAHQLVSSGTLGSSSSVRYFASSARSNRASRSSRIGVIGCRLRVTRSPSSVQIRLIFRHSGDMPGKSSRVWPPRLSWRSSAACATQSAISTMLRRSRARCQPGL